MTVYRVIIEVEVKDEAALKAAAEAQAYTSSLTPEEWQDLRNDSGDDILMLFDPGAASPPGTSILHSEVEVLP